jgi:hypothetical protein
MGVVTLVIVKVSVQLTLGLGSIGLIGAIVGAGRVKLVALVVAATAFCLKGEVES